mmetsp:Transcript_3915/g.11062  ORF Transcript_3915/g.11062 Transcript_3915/m.11062 type:complete len:309 (-) Transcript_3915:902-1828(-)
MLVHARGLGEVRLDAAHKVRVCGLQRLDKLGEGGAETVNHTHKLGRPESTRALGRAALGHGLGGRVEELRHHLHLGALEQHGEVHRQRILVLGHKAHNCVAHLGGKVLDVEHAAAFGARKVGVGFVHGEALLHAVEEGLVRRVAKHTLLAEDLQDAWLRRRPVNECDHLGVVGEGDVRHRDALLLVHGHLRLEDGRHEEALQALIGVVDTQLLQRVDAEGLKAEDVDCADEARCRIVQFGVALASARSGSSCVRSSLESGVELANDPLEEVGKESLAQRITHGARLLIRVGLVYDLGSHLDVAARERA